jgi:hypothetical protein
MNCFPWEWPAPLNPPMGGKTGEVLPVGPVLLHELPDHPASFVKHPRRNRGELLPRKYILFGLHFYCVDFDRPPLFQQKGFV